MRYLIILIIMAGCTSKPTPSNVNFRSDTTKWLGVYVRDTGLFYDVVILERKWSGRLDSTGKASAVLDSVFYIPIKFFDSTTKKDSVSYLNARPGSVRILENFDSSLKHLTEWIKKNKK